MLSAGLWKPKLGNERQAGSVFAISEVVSKNRHRPNQTNPVPREKIRQTWTASA